jgi:hypothetical protein
MIKTLLTAIAGAALSTAAAAMLQPGGAQAAGRPSCARVTHTVGNVTQTVWVRNGCSHTLSFLVRAAGPDSPCLHAAPGRARGWWWPRPLAYQGTSFGCD